MEKWLQAGQNILGKVAAEAEQKAAEWKEAQERQRQEAENAAAAAAAAQGGAVPHTPANPFGTGGQRGPPQPARAPPENYRAPPPGVPPGGGGEIGAVDVTIHECVLDRVFDSFRQSQDIYVKLFREYEDGMGKEVGTTRTARGSPENDNGKHPRIAEHFMFKRAGGLQGGGAGRPQQLQLVKAGKPIGVIRVSISPHAEESGSAAFPGPMGTGGVGDYGKRPTATGEGPPPPPGQAPGYPVPKQNQPPASPREFRRHLEYLLDRPEELEDKVQKRFRQIAKPVPPDGKRALKEEQLFQYVEETARKLNVNKEAFGDIGQMFWRFEITGHQVLYEPEAVKLMILMLRNYRDNMKTPEKGHVKLGGTICHRSPDEKYQKIKELGRGGQGIAQLAQVKNTQPAQQVVLKIYAKSNKNAPVEEIAQEFELLTRLKHPKIARVYDIFEDYSNVYIVMEPYFGGDLTKLIQNAQEASVKINEQWFSKVLAQVVSGVDFLHSHLVMHCDLKEPNVMVVDKSFWEDPQVIVIDFGLANKFSSKSSGGGTPGYIPPEVWKSGLWTPRGDVFSTGVMMYSLWSYGGENPFVKGCTTIDDVAKKTMSERPAMPYGSSALRTLVYNMMNPVMVRRPVARQVLQDAWFLKNQTVGGQDMPVEALQKLANRQKKSEMYKALLADVASRENLSQLKEMNELFVRLDGDNDGVISAEDVRKALKGRWKDDQIENMIEALMGADDSKVNYEEFMGQMMADQALTEDAFLQKVFKEADKRGQGFLTTAEMVQLLNGANMSTWMQHQKKDAYTLVREMDLDQDGKISFHEFKAALVGQSTSGADTGGWPQKGMPAEYHSPSFGGWIPCTVVAADSGTGAVQVDVKPGYWFQGDELRRKIRQGKPGRGGEIDQHQAKKAGAGRQLIFGAYGGGG